MRKSVKPMNLIQKLSLKCGKAKIKMKRQSDGFPIRDAYRQLNPEREHQQSLIILTNGREILSRMCGFNSITHFCFSAYVDIPLIK